LSEYLITAYFAYSAESRFGALSNHVKWVADKMHCQHRNVEYQGIEDNYIHEGQYKLTYQFKVKANDAETAIEKFRDKIDVGTVISCMKFHEGS